MKKLFLLLATLSIFWTASAQQPATYINGTPPPFIFTGGGVSQNGQTFTFSNGGGGSVTSFSAGTLSPLFTTSVATPTATPALSFTLSNAAQNSIFAGPPSGGAAAPSFQTAPTFALTNATGLPAAQLLSGALGNGMTATTQSQLDGSTKLATNAYVDLAVSNAVAGVNPAVAVLAASTANIAGTYTQVGGGVGDFFTVTATGTFSLDGIAINTIGQRVLLKDQSTASQNGVYFATVVGAVAVSPVFTRALDYDTPSDVNNTGAIPVQSGTVNTTTSWLLTSQVVSIGSAGSSLTYAKFSIAPSSLVTASSPGAGIARFAGSTQAVTSAELSGDVTTSGSNAATVVQIEGAAIPASAAYVGTNSSKQLVAATAPAWFNLTGTVTVAGCAVSSGACAISGSSTTAVTFSVIPGTYNRLQIIIWGQGSATLNVNTTFNSDTAANYAVNGYVQTSTTNPTANAAASQAFCAGSGMTTGIVSTLEINIPFYANTSFGKAVQVHASEIGSISALASNFDITTGCAWNGTAAITSVTMTASTGHYVAGTEFMILGQN